MIAITSLFAGGWWEDASAVVGLAAAAIIALGVIRKTILWRPLAFAGKTLGLIWRSAFGEPMSNMFSRWQAPAIAASDCRIVDRIEALAARNDAQHTFVEGELVGVKTELAGVKSRLTLVEDAVRSNVGPIATEETPT